MNKIVISYGQYYSMLLKHETAIIQRAGSEQFVDLCTFDARELHEPFSEKWGHFLLDQRCPSFVVYVEGSYHIGGYRYVVEHRKLLSLECLSQSGYLICRPVVDK